MVRRPGHSLPELIVAVTFLGTTVAAVGGTAVLGGRWAGRAVARQEAVRVATQVLDSLTAVAGAGAGRADVGGLVARWRTQAGGLRVEVAARVDGPPLAVLVGRPVPAAPVLPDVDSVSDGDGAWSAPDGGGLVGGGR